MKTVKLREMLGLVEGGRPSAETTRIARQRRAEERKAQMTAEELAYQSAMHLANKWRDYPLSPFNASTQLVDGVVVCHPARTKLCIVGAGYGRDEAPLEDSEWMVFGLNACAPLDSHGRLRADAWFDIHQRCAQSDDDMKYIRECPFPIYVPDDLVDAGPNCVRYPIEAVERTAHVSYFACTFAYQLALALHMGTVTDVGLFGVELAYGTARERSVEWANVSYWLGRVEQAGLTVHLPGRSILGSHPFRYGLEYDAELDSTQAYVDMMAAADARRRMENQ